MIKSNKIQAFIETKNKSSKMMNNKNKKNKTQSLIFKIALRNSNERKKIITRNKFNNNKEELQYLHFNNQN